MARSSWARVGVLWATHLIDEVADDDSVVVLLGLAVYGYNPARGMMSRKGDGG